MHLYNPSNAFVIMYDLYFENFNKKVPLTGGEQALIATHLSTKKLRKKQYILQAGDVCKTITFVEKGLLRAYSLNNEGVEHIMQFAPEGWLISDMYSFLTIEPATYNIDAIEDTELVLISKQSHEDLLNQCPKYERFTRLLITNAYIAMQKRLSAVTTLTVEQRYESFIAIYPHIAQRVPQHMIASYLGLTPETLSRIRRRLAVKG